MQEVFAEVSREWILKGAARGEAKALVFVLERRFGLLPMRVQRQIGEAPRVMLEVWLKRVADGAMLDAVFCEEEKEANDEDELLSKAARELLAEGEAKGEAQALVVMLERQFGLLPEDLLVRIREAGQATIGAWLARAADGASLEAVFADPTNYWTGRGTPQD